MNFGLTTDTINKFNSVFVKYIEIDEVIIYGSRAKGNFRAGSDIDFTFKGKDIKESVMSNIYSDLDTLNTPYLFDISIFEKLNSPDLVEHINRIGKLFYKKSL